MPVVPTAAMVAAARRAMIAALDLVAASGKNSL